MWIKSPKWERKNYCTYLHPTQSVLAFCMPSLLIYVSFSLILKSDFTAYALPPFPSLTVYWFISLVHDSHAMYFIFILIVWPFDGIQIFVVKKIPKKKKFMEENNKRYYSPIVFSNLNWCCIRHGWLIQVPKGIKSVHNDHKIQCGKQI